MPGGNTRNQAFVPPHHLYADDGDGCRLWDVDGNERVDFVNNLTVSILGHSNPVVISAVQQQVGKLVSSALATEAEIELAEVICERCSNFEQIRFMNTGSEAVMQMIKAARAYTGRSKIVKCEGLYHGSYDYAEVSLDSNPQNWGQSEYRSVGFAQGVPQGVLDDVIVIPFNDAMRTRKILERHEDDVAAVLIDLAPSRCAGILANDDFLNVLNDYRQSSGALIACDEVISFRLHYGGAQTMLDFKPDLTSLGKVIGGGLPIGAVAGRADVMDVFNSTNGKALVPQSGTFTANPLSMVAGATTLKIFNHAEVDRINSLGELTRRRLQDALSNFNVPGQVTGEGSLFFLTFSDEPLSDYRSVYRQPNQIMEKLFYELLNRGVFMTNWGLGCLSTPMEEKEIDFLVTTVSESLSKIEIDLER